MSQFTDLSYPVFASIYIALLSNRKEDDETVATNVAQLSPLVLQIKQLIPDSGDTVRFATGVGNLAQSAVGEDWDSVYSASIYFISLSNYRRLQRTPVRLLAGSIDRSVEVLGFTPNTALACRLKLSLFFMSPGHTATLLAGVIVYITAKPDESGGWQVHLQSVLERPGFFESMTMIMAGVLLPQFVYDSVNMLPRIDPFHQSLRQIYRDQNGSTRHDGMNGWIKLFEAF